MAHHHEQKVPKSILWAALGMMLLALGVSAYARKDVAAATEAPASVVASAELRFEDRPNGAIGVLDGTTGREVAVVPPASNGFVRGVLRGMFRTRKLESLDRASPFRLTHYRDGRLGLEDLASGRIVDLSSFGPDNHAAFAKLLAAAENDGRSAKR